MQTQNDVIVEYKVDVPKNKQLAEFYCNGGWYEMATITKGDKVVHVGVNGEMHLSIPNIKDGELVDSYDPICYGNELSYEFKDDLHFVQFIKTASNSGFEVYRMNPWWEVFSNDDPDGYVSDESNFYDVISSVLSLLEDEV